MRAYTHIRELHDCSSFEFHVLVLDLASDFIICLCDELLFVVLVRSETSNEILKCSLPHDTLLVWVKQAVSVYLLMEDPPPLDRSSTETTIFTIYSMYGNDESSSRELDLSFGDTFTYNNTFFHATAYTDLSSDARPRSMLVNPHEVYATNPPGNSLELSPRRSRVPSGQNRPRSTVTSCTSQADSDVVSPPVLPTSLPTPPHSRPPSSLRRSDSPLPDPTLPPKPSTSLALPPPPSTQTTSSSPTTGQPSKLSPPSSKTSLVPSEGEDLDAFHVRSTYAQLDAIGVKGDGYEDGVERTRARQRGSRTSELRVDAAPGNPSEKSRDLLAEEVHLLASLDRWVTSHPLSVHCLFYYQLWFLHRCLS